MSNLEKLNNNPEIKSAPESEANVQESISEEKKMEKQEEVDVDQHPTTEETKVEEPEVEEPKVEEPKIKEPKAEEPEVEEDKEEPKTEEPKVEEPEAEEPKIKEPKAEEAEEKPVPDFNTLSLKEIVLYFEEMLERGDRHEMHKYADIIKASFYRVLKKEKVALAQSKEEILPKDTPTTGEDEVSVNPFLEIERGFKNLYRRYRELRKVHLAQFEKEKEQNLIDKREVIEELKALLEKQEDLQHTFPAFRELQNRWRAIGPVPQAANKNLWETYQFHVEKFYDFVKINKELRDLDIKKNLEQKIKLCEKAEALLDETYIVPAFRKLQKYHDAWREIGPVPKEQREEIWERFRAATSTINRRQQEYFEGLKEEHKKNYELKKALCEKAEAIANIEGEKQWNKLTKEMQALQKEWRTIGFCSKRENQKVYDRFRAACDKFYDEKRAFYASFKVTMEENLKKKIALCEEAEAIKDSDDWNKTTNRLIALQKEWKEIGPVTRKQSDAVWKRFRAACDHFFEKKSSHYSGAGERYEQNLEDKETLIKEVENFSLSQSKEENVNSYREFMERWHKIGFVPIAQKDQITALYYQAIKEKFGDFVDSEEEAKIERFTRRIKSSRERGRGGDRAVRAERDKLIQKLRKIEQDILLWENNIGFFAKSKKADNIIKDIEAKISEAREEVAQIEEKIKLIDKQYQ